MKAYANGPLPDDKRSKTDCLCFVIFVLFSVAMLAIGIYAWTNGNFKKLTNAYDPDGKGCGVDYPNSPYIYFAQPSPNSLYVTTCVSACPNATSTVLACQVNSLVTSCDPKVFKSLQIYDSYSLSVVCMPTSAVIQAQISSALGSNSDQISSLQNGYKMILIAIPIAIVLSILFLLIIRFTAGIFIYLLIFFSIAALGAFGGYLLAANPATASSTTITILANRPACIAIGVVCIVLSVLLLVMFICFRKRVSLASSIIKVSAKFVDSELGILLLPLILFVVMLFFVLLWILQALGYYSLGTPIQSPQQLPFQHFETPWSIVALGFVHVFYLFWVMMFIVETASFIIGGAATGWYFLRESPYTESSARYRIFHIGSVALGSFFLALIGFIKFLYEVLTPDQAKQGTCLGSWKKFCDCICCLCVGYLFSNFNSGAYTMIHLSGNSYCPSAFEVLGKKMSEPITTGVVAVLQIIFTILIRVGITALTCLAIYVMIQNVQSFHQGVNDSTLIMILTGVIAFTISSLFVSVYSDAMDAIYVSYLIDKDAGGSSQEDKCPEELKNFLAEAKKEQGFVE